MYKQLHICIWFLQSFVQVALTLHNIFIFWALHEFLSLHGPNTRYKRWSQKHEWLPPSQCDGGNFNSLHHNVM